MISLLSKLLIKDYQNVASSAVRLRYGVLCGAVGIFFNALLFAGKLIAGTLTGSIGITADAFNNLSDAGSSAITLVGFRLSDAKADKEHPFGHGRFEYISGLIVSMAILLMGVELVKASVERIVHPEAVAFSFLAMGILVASILVKIYMFLYNRRIGKKIDSAAMRATAMDSFSDVAATSVVLLSMLVSKWTGWLIDGYAGLLVALFILYTGVRAAKETISPLLGQSPKREFVERIERIVLEQEGVIGVHDLVVHDYGPGRRMISLHAEVPAGGDMILLHDTVDNLEKLLRKECGCETVIHMDPVETNNAETNRLRAETLAILTALDARLTLHDFRVVAGPTHTNLVFDVVVPFGFSMTDEAVRNAIFERIHALEGTCFAVIEIDKSSVRAEEQDAH
ncbi:MAG: cation diffusion facilitator family transporter [Eubacteriales bacterium]|jgi:cation diffusion facilitator family transporter|nr:cation diffusion facilitator family transporter [Eubacteriales bacterium]